MAIKPVSCIDCGASSTEGKIYIDWFGGRKHYRCIDCMLDNEISAIRDNTGVHVFILVHKDEFRAFLESHTDIYGEEEEE